MNKTFAMALSVVISITIWLLSGLSQPHSGLVSVQVIASSDIYGRSSVSADKASVVAMVTTTGYRLIALNSGKKVVKVNFDSSHLSHREDDFFSISSTSLFRYVPDIFGADVTVQSFVSSSVTFRFPEQTHKKVPVVATGMLDFDEQYMPLEPFRLSPDSVTLYGSPERIGDIDKVLTKPIGASEIRRSLHGVASIDVPAGTRADVTEVTYSMEVSRFVELRTTAKVSVHGLPEGKNLRSVPSKVEMRVRFVFPISGNPQDRYPELYVDYEDFKSSIGGKCIVKYDALPSGAIDMKIVPPVCECVEDLTQ